MNSLAQAISKNLEMNLRVIKLNMDGLTHEQTLIQPPQGATV